MAGLSGVLVSSSSSAHSRFLNRRPLVEDIGDGDIVYTPHISYKLRVDSDSMVHRVFPSPKCGEPFSLTWVWPPSLRPIIGYSVLGQKVQGVRNRGQTRGS